MFNIRKVLNKILTTEDVFGKKKKNQYIQYLLKAIYSDSFDLLPENQYRKTLWSHLFSDQQKGIKTDLSIPLLDNTHR